MFATALLTTTALTGCASSRLSSEAPPGAHLSGDWKLDVARSDDLGKAVDQLIAQREAARRRAGSEQQQGSGGGQRSSNGPEFGPGPTPRASSVDELMSSVPRGDYLRITVSADAFTVASGNSSEEYTPGLESDISAERGDAHQISGWKGPVFVIDTKPQWGPEIIQSYTLTKDDRLAMAVRLSGSGTKLTFTRVYDRTTQVAPLAPPTNN